MSCRRSRLSMRSGMYIPHLLVDLANCLSLPALCNYPMMRPRFSAVYNHLLHLYIASTSNYYHWRFDKWYELKLKSVVSSPKAESRTTNSQNYWMALRVLPAWRRHLKTGRSCKTILQELYRSRSGAIEQIGQSKFCFTFISVQKNYLLSRLRICCWNGLLTL